MFLGQFQHNIDAKGRMTIPVRFRELLENGAIINSGLDGNLTVSTKENFEIMVGKVEKLSPTNTRARELKRILFGDASKIEFDRLGRILIPSFLREKAQLADEAIVVGVGESFEIWAPELWKNHQLVLEAAKADEERFADLDISIG